MTPFIRLHPADDVLIARSQMVGGTTVEGIAVKGLIPAGHKVAIIDLDLRQRVTINKMNFQALRQTIGRTAAEESVSSLFD